MSLSFSAIKTTSAKPSGLVADGLDLVSIARVRLVAATHDELERTLVREPDGPLRLHRDCVAKRLECLLVEATAAANICDAKERRGRSWPALSRTIMHVQRLLSTPVEPDRAEARRRFVEEAFVGASSAKRTERERLDVIPRVDPLQSLGLDPLARAEGDQRIQERCSTVVQTDTVYSGGRPIQMRPEIHGVDEPLDR
jgi:hypothetical protein